MFFFFVVNIELFNTDDDTINYLFFFYEWLYTSIYIWIQSM